MEPVQTFHVSHKRVLLKTVTHFGMQLIHRTERAQGNDPGGAEGIWQILMNLQ